MKTVLWRGFFPPQTGIGHASRTVPLSLEKHGIPCKIQPLQPLEKGDPLEKFIADPSEKGFTVLHQLPTVDPTCDAYYCVTEFDIPPHEWWNTLRRCKLIITQSKFCVDSFCRVPGMDRNKIKKTIFPVPETMRPNGPKLEDMTNLKSGKELKQYKFLFGSVFEWVARKKPELMFEAFRNEFPIKEYPDVGLFCKMMFKPQYSPRNWRQFLKGDMRIMFSFQDFVDMAPFYRSLDCYLSPSAGEGWSATLAEAMCCGIPTIGSNHGGNLEFMTPENSYLTDTTDWVEVGNDPTNKLWMVHDYQRWKLPKVESIQKAMREVYELKMAGKKNPKVKEALKLIDVLTIESAGRFLKDALLPFL